MTRRHDAGISSELAAGIKRMKADLATAMVRVGGIGASVTGRQSNGGEICGIVTSTINGFMIVILAPDGRRYAIPHAQVAVAS